MAAPWGRAPLPLLVPLSLLLLCSACAALPSNTTNDVLADGSADSTTSVHRRSALSTFARRRPKPRPTDSFLRPYTQIAPVCQKAAPTVALTIASPVAVTRLWKGWGTSLAWYAQYIGGLKPSQYNPFLDLLFHKTRGLGLNIVRFNIGGGLNPSNSPQLVKPKNPLYKFRAMPGYKASATAKYNWAADFKQRVVLAGAIGRGANKFIAFSNSPPWWMTVSGDVAGGVKATSNLRANMYPAFANYLADVVQQYATQYKVVFNFLQPFNEPGGTWAKGGTQEGCTFTPAEVARLLPLVNAALRARKLTTKLAAFDEFAATTPRFAAALSSQIMNQVAHLHVHGYELSPPSKKTARAIKNAADFSAAAAVAVRTRKEIWLTEWGPLSAAGSDIGLALYMSRTIIQAVNQLKASAWSYWQPLDVDPKWTLITTAWNATANTQMLFGWTKKYMALLQFTRTIPSGSIPIDIGSLNGCSYSTAAFYVACRNQVVFTAVNQETTTQAVTLKLAGFKKAVGGTKMVVLRYTTSETENVKLGNGGEVDATFALKVTLKPRTLTTLVISNVMSRNAAVAVCRKV